MGNSLNGATVADFNYYRDPLGRITNMTKWGSLTASYGTGNPGLRSEYSYTDRSELKSEQTFLGWTTTLLPGRDNGTAGSPGFTYDNLGNRKTTKHNGNTATYTVNALNQYTNRTVPGYFDVAGSSASPTVNVMNNGGPPIDTAARSGQYFFDGYPLANATTAVYTTLWISDNPATHTTLPAFLAPSNFANLYDFDGNLTDDGRWAYAYNAKNQLVSAQTAAAALGVSVPRVKYDFRYDYLGRRFKKTTSVWSGGVWVYQSEQRFIYNGWNLAAVLDGNLAVQRNFFWGLDLSGTLQGAGGVGGLLMTQEAGQSYLPLADALGNVHGMIKASDGTVAAAYDYDAFGNTLRETGPYAANNPFRFSTKYTDIETGLVYYGQRYYSPSLGRFINQDPIEEAGGLNLYGFCGNNGVNRWDYLGQDFIGSSGKNYGNDYGAYLYGGDHAVDPYFQTLMGGSGQGAGVSINQGQYRVTYPDGSFVTVNASSGAEAQAIANTTTTTGAAYIANSLIVTGSVVAPNRGGSSTNAVGTIYGHSVFVIAEHGSIRIYPDNPDAIDQALAAKGFPKTQTDANGQRYVVFSGGPDYAKGTDSFLGNLGGNINNRPSDLASSPNTVIGTISAPAGVSKDQFTLTLIMNTANYNNGNKTDYDLLPPIQNGYNSNSYFTGLASSAGGTINTSLSWQFIGSGKPLPPSSFTPNPNPGGPGP